MFHAWMETFRPGSLFVPVVRVLNGNQKDALFEGAFSLYVGCSHMVAFLNECLCPGKTALTIHDMFFKCMLTHITFFQRSIGK